MRCPKDCLISELERLKNSEVAKVVGSRIREFEALGKKPSREIFKELCFCLLTANFNAERSIFIQKEIGDDFLNLPPATLSKRLEELGHRYPNARAKYIAEAREVKDVLKTELEKQNNSFCAREWLVQNVKGLGYKESSHFLRNIGHKDVAIIDFHIVD
ncbi:MAG: N-glycosylase/DNA lyase, partial [Candidatus Aenigmatarchaeota archaeon]